MENLPLAQAVEGDLMSMRASSTTCLGAALEQPLRSPSQLVDALRACAEEATARFDANRIVEATNLYRLCAMRYAASDARLLGIIQCGQSAKEDVSTFKAMRFAFEDLLLRLTAETGDKCDMYLCYHYECPPHLKASRANGWRIVPHDPRLTRCFAFARGRASLPHTCQRWCRDEANPSKAPRGVKTPLGAKLDLQVVTAPGGETHVYSKPPSQVDGVYVEDVTSIHPRKRARPVFRRVRTFAPTDYPPTSSSCAQQ